MPRQYLTAARPQARAYSRAVITTGGRTVWLAGQTAPREQNGQSLAGDLEGQTRAIFAALGTTLREAGGTLKNIVTMTVFINDPRHGERFVEIRREYFPDGFPASALITVSGFARPETMIEIQAIAVIE